MTIFWGVELSFNTLPAFETCKIERFKPADFQILNCKTTNSSLHIFFFSDELEGNMKYNNYI